MTETLSSLRNRLAVAAAWGGVALLAGTAVVAQTPDSALLAQPGERCSADAIGAALPDSHWGLAAAERAERLGLLPVYLPSQRRASRSDVAAALCDAAVRAAGGPYAALAAGWLARWRDEFGDGAVTHVARGGIRGDGRNDAAAPGLAEFEPERTGALPLPDRSDLTGAASLSGTAFGRVALLVEPEIGTDGARLPRWEAALGVSTARIAFGRTEVEYGPGFGGGVMLSGQVPEERLTLETARAVRLPGVFRLLGPVAFHSSFARLGEARHPGKPFFFSARGAFRPHPRLTLALQRASIFGGDSALSPTTPRTVGRMLLGIHTVRFDNQIVTGEGRLRLPTENRIPLVVYAEVGSEDRAGSVTAVPGFLVGTEVPALPGLPEVALAVEWARFGERCCGNPPWYRHNTQRGNWASGDWPLGHPLGGEGSELGLRARGDLDDARLRLDARLWLRDRRGENLYLPGRGGGSRGGSASVAWRFAPAGEATLAAETDVGDEWSERRGRAGVVFWLR